VESSAQIGRLMLDGLEKIAQRHGTIANVRGRGLLIGFDLVTDPETKQLLPKEACVRFFKECLADGLIAMSYSPRVRIHPPLVLSADEAMQALAIIDGALARL
jgi:4-aminobutyrate aminotransferase-like enzyme